MKIVAHSLLETATFSLQAYRAPNWATSADMYNGIT